MIAYEPDAAESEQMVRWLKENRDTWMRYALGGLRRAVADERSSAIRDDAISSIDAAIEFVGGRNPSAALEALRHARSVMLNL